MTTFMTVSALAHTHPMPGLIPSPPRGVWELGPIPIRAYALCIIIGIVVTGIWGSRRFQARGGRPGAIGDLAIWAIPFGIVGGRLYHIVSDPELYFGNSSFISEGRWHPWGVFEIWDGGLGIWGAIALGALGTYIGCRRYKIPFGALADSVAPGVVLAQGIGRVGNYFNQELFGAHTGLPWGLEVFLRTPGGVAGTAAQCGTGEFPTEWIKASPTVLCGTYHPTFLYELIWDVLIALLVVWADRHFRLGHGRACGLYVAGYTFGRGWIEMVRIDHANHILGLRLNVFVAAIVFIAAVVFLVLTHGKQREDPATVYGVPPLRDGAGTDGAGTDGRDGVGTARDPDEDDGDDEAFYYEDVDADSGAPDRGEGADEVGDADADEPARARATAEDGAPGRGDDESPAETAIPVEEEPR